MTELLIVIGIIVLVLALALPAFNAITGAKSESQAINQVAALLGRVRNEAIGLQESRGLFFFPDPAGDHYKVAIVHTPEVSEYISTSTYVPGSYTKLTPLAPPGSLPNYYICIQLNSNADNHKPTETDYWTLLKEQTLARNNALVEQVEDTDTLSLPKGIGVQLLCDAKRAAGANGNSSDAYLLSGAIIFDRTGRLTSQPLYVSYAGALGTAMGFNIENGPDDYPRQGSPCLLPNNVNPTFESSYGFVLYDRDALKAQPFVSTENDYNVIYPDPKMPVVSVRASEFQTDDRVSAPVTSKEAWLDRNAQAFLINRYNGSLIKSE